MNETNKNQKQKPRTSKLAKVASNSLFVPFGLFISLFLLSLILEKEDFPDWFTFNVFNIILFISTFVAFILGLVALIHIWLGKCRLSGMNRSVSVMVISGAFIICLLEAGKTRKDVCFHDLRSLSAAINRYALKNTGHLPMGENWCDLMITDAGVDYKCFDHGEESDLIFGESAYALNKNVADMKLSDIPDDVVLLFETSPGWNKVGGPEILTTEYHQGKGCKILFADGISRFIKTKDLDTLRWEP